MMRLRLVYKFEIYSELFDIFINKHYMHHYEEGEGHYKLELLELESHDNKN